RRRGGSRRGCGSLGRLSALIALSALVPLIIRRLNRNDLRYCLHKIVRRRDCAFREKELDLSEVSDLIPRRVRVGVTEGAHKDTVLLGDNPRHPELLAGDKLARCA